MITTREAGYHWLAVLAGELYVRLRDARETTDGLWPKSLVIGTRQGEAGSRSYVQRFPVAVSQSVSLASERTSRHRQMTFPFTRNLSTDYIAKYANKLWDEVTEPTNRSLKVNNVS